MLTQGHQRSSNHPVTSQLTSCAIFRRPPYLSKITPHVLGVSWAMADVASKPDVMQIIRLKYDSRDVVLSVVVMREVIIKQ